jgi:ribosomal protein S27AE
MSKVLRYGREQVTIDEEASEAPKVVPCPNCGTPMTHHADKVVPAAASSENDVVIAAARACSECGTQTTSFTSTPVTELPELSPVA